MSDQEQVVLRKYTGRHNSARITAKNVLHPM